MAKKTKKKAVKKQAAGKIAKKKITKKKVTKKTSGKKTKGKKATKKAPAKKSSPKSAAKKKIAQKATASSNKKATARKGTKKKKPSPPKSPTKAKKVTKKQTKKKAETKKPAAKKTVKEQASKSATQKKTTKKSSTSKVNTASPQRTQPKNLKKKKSQKAPPQRQVTKETTHDVRDAVEKINDEIAILEESFPTVNIRLIIKKLDFFSSKNDECLEKGCDNPVATLGFCRFHYIKNWKEIKRKQQILSEGKLTKLIEELIEKFPVKYVETILTDLADDKAFYAALKELNIETAFDDPEGAEGDEAFESNEIHTFKSERSFEDEET